MHISFIGRNYVNLNKNFFQLLFLFLLLTALFFSVTIAVKVILYYSVTITVTVNWRNTAWRPKSWSRGASRTNSKVLVLFLKTKSYLHHCGIFGPVLKLTGEYWRRCGRYIDWLVWVRVDYWTRYSASGCCLYSIPASMVQRLLAAHSPLSSPLPRLFHAPSLSYRPPASLDPLSQSRVCE